MAAVAPANWIIMTVEAQGQRAVCRLLAEKPGRDLPLLVQIAWAYTDDDERGFPSLSLRSSMEAFEEAIEELTSAELALVVTGMGMKQWSFYTRSLDAFSREFKALMSGKAPVPIRITHRLDSKWQYWWDFRKRAVPAGSAS